VAPGEPGDVVITDLHNLGMPMIRYANGDVAVGSPAARCPCGRGLARIARVDGRRADTYQVVRTLPHDPRAFTQGLFWMDGYLWESTGLNGRSGIRKVDLETGRVVQQQSIPQEYFGEGLAAFGSNLYELTWTSGIAIVWDKATFTVEKQFRYQGEGWGLTTDGKRLIMSDGTEHLRFLDPSTFQEIRRVAVTDDGRPVTELNELEYIRGEVFANVWMTNRIARINPETGRVNSWIDLTGILPAADAHDVDVLNGIAYDADADRLYVTGKLWPRLFEIKVVPRR
jgi:glutamine cyclotransferase